MQGKDRKMVSGYIADFSLFIWWVWVWI